MISNATCQGPPSNLPPDFAGMSELPRGSCVDASRTSLSRFISRGTAIRTDAAQCLILFDVIDNGSLLARNRSEIWQLLTETTSLSDQIALSLSRAASIMPQVASPCGAMYAGSRKRASFSLLNAHYRDMVNSRSNISRCFRIPPLD